MRKGITMYVGSHRFHIHFCWHNIIVWIALDTDA